jgi:hypothetical protein
MKTKKWRRKKARRILQRGNGKTTLRTTKNKKRALQDISLSIFWARMKKGGLLLL